MTDTLSYTLRTAAIATGLSKTHLTAAINSGQLRAKRSGVDEDGNPTGLYVIPADALQAYIDGLVDA